MELVYLWVEDYKNIQKQGFNFSPRFTCEYDGKELTIKENDDYIENFFGDNINVTAIVGKNGSGKSSLLELIEDIYSDDVLSPFIFIFVINDKIEFITNIKIISNIEVVTFDFLTYSGEMPYPYFKKRRGWHEDNLAISLDEEDIYEMVASHLNDDFHLSSFMYTPKKIYIAENQYLSNDLLDEIRPAFIMRSQNNENGMPYEDCHSERENYVPSNILEAFFLNRIIDNSLCEEFFSTSINIEELYNRKEYGLNQEDYQLDEFLEVLNKTFSYDTLRAEERKIIDKYMQFLQFDFEDLKKRKFSHLSHGEKSIFGQFINIYDKLEQMRKDNILILLDEPDLSLHPQWQKSYINEFYNMFSKLNKKNHIVLTSHSPFLLSDIPKQNIIFLDKDEKGNCKVVNGLKEKKQTFGANIHTLLNDSFFMEDGLMGEFAKGKIDKAIRLLNQDKLDEKDLKYCEQIISIIGEPIVKNQLQRMLTDKKISYLAKDTREEIEFLKHRIDLLSKRL